MNLYQMMRELFFMFMIIFFTIGAELGILPALDNILIFPAEPETTILTTHLSSDAIDLHAIDFTQSVALVFGNEVFGVAQKAVEICNGTIEIPQLGTKHSLNIAVSAGIVIWDFFKKMR